jgi:hypothetical protein
MKYARTFGLLAAFVAASTSCNRNSGGGGGNGNTPPVVNPADPESYAPKGSTPPVVVSFNIAFAENVPLPALQAMATKFETVNESLWNATEGQIRIGRIRISDNAHPNSSSQDYKTLNLSAQDIVVWAPANFNGPGIAYVLVGAGRYGRFMGIPSSIANTTLMHELGHFLFELSWSVAPVLVDEYVEDPDDVACMMELTYNPLQWCSPPNHESQVGQPHSCWTQILIDYPDFRYMNLNIASPQSPPPIMIEYTDTPLP